MDRTEPSTTKLMRIRASHPGWQVCRVEGGMWQALRTSGSGERVIVRQSLAALEDRLDELAST